MFLARTIFRGGGRGGIWVLASLRRPSCVRATGALVPPLTESVPGEDLTGQEAVGRMNGADQRAHSLLEFPHAEAWRRTIDEAKPDIG